ncbi:flavin reductase family protein [Dongia soli]|uniref:Flavin reductase family protein n=1 Tax=Dongia soli TaxID=600628 RepID=A0ABU5ELF6_9PROT|nr:flavin reductase family protein [Dongia soli]MDY0885873.1 flavin reductase family protein [Dongia soli]
MPIDQREFRAALGHFATGITVVTARAKNGELLGITANSFNSVSLVPPLVLFSLDRRALSLAAFEEAGGFAINVLDDTQSDLSRNFARAMGDKWSGVDYEQWETGSPILTSCLANFDCRTYAIHDGGDHRIFIGEVLRFSAQPEGNPLLYFRGGYAALK